jgi:hypothetical protein
LTNYQIQVVWHWWSVAIGKGRSMSSSAKSRPVIIAEQVNSDLQRLNVPKSVASVIQGYLLSQRPSSIIVKFDWINWLNQPAGIFSQYLEISDNTGNARKLVFVVFDYGLTDSAVIVRVVEHSELDLEELKGSETDRAAKALHKAIQFVLDE